MVKPKVAIHSITGCAGCQLEIYFVEDILLQILDKIDLVAAPMIKEQNYDGKVDICFIEGSVTYDENIEQIKKWRENADIIVALGACACDGGVQQQKHFMDKEVVEHYVYGEERKHLKAVPPTPISDHIEVDFYIKGCPADKEEFLWFLKQLLVGKTPKQYEKSICHECKLRENHCLLEQGRECYGPITYGHCSIMCPDFNHACTCCRGPMKDANFEEHIKLLVEKGYDEQQIRQRMQKYAGLRVEKLMNNDKNKS